MSFDAIPEDRCESFPCPQCAEGSVTQNEQGVWECDKCDFSRAQPEGWSVMSRTVYIVCDCALRNRKLYSGRVVWADGTPVGEDDSDTMNGLELKLLGLVPNMGSVHIINNIYSGYIPAHLGRYANPKDFAERKLTYGQTDMPRL